MIFPAKRYFKYLCKNAANNKNGKSALTEYVGLQEANIKALSK